MKYLKLTTTLFVLILLGGLETTAQQKSRWLSYEPAIITDWKASTILEYTFLHSLVTESLTPPALPSKR